MRTLAPSSRARANPLHSGNWAARSFFSPTAAMTPFSTTSASTLSLGSEGPKAFYTIYYGGDQIKTGFRFSNKPIPIIGISRSKLLFRPSFPQRVTVNNYVDWQRFSNLLGDWRGAEAAVGNARGDASDGCSSAYPRRFCGPALPGLRLPPRIPLRTSRGSYSKEQSQEERWPP
jgi:hypothetical protein